MLLRVNDCSLSSFNDKDTCGRTDPPLPPAHPLLHVSSRHCHEPTRCTSVAAVVHVSCLPSLFLSPRLLPCCRSSARLHRRSRHADKRVLGRCRVGRRWDGREHAHDVRDLARFFARHRVTPEVIAERLSLFDGDTTKMPQRQRQDKGNKKCAEVIHVLRAGRDKARRRQKKSCGDTCLTCGRCVSVNFREGLWGRHYPMEGNCNIGICCEVKVGRWPGGRAATVRHLRR